MILNVTEGMLTILNSWWGLERWEWMLSVRRRRALLDVTSTLGKSHPATIANGVTWRIELSRPLFTLAPLCRYRLHCSLFVLDTKTRGTYLTYSAVYRSSTTLWKALCYLAIKAGLATSS